MCVSDARHMTQTEARSPFPSPARTAQEAWSTDRTGIKQAASVFTCRNSGRGLRSTSPGGEEDPRITAEKKPLPNWRRFLLRAERGRSKHAFKLSHLSPGQERLQDVPGWVCHTELGKASGGEALHLASSQRDISVNLNHTT